MKFLSKKNIVLGLIVLIGAVLRFYKLPAVALWHDEAFSALLIRYPFGEMMTRIALDVHPPLYYWALRAWDILFGDSLFALRSFSAFFGVLTIYFVYLFVRDAFKNERLALISTLLIAVNPFQIQYATEARMYTFGTFIIALSSWFLVKAIESNPSRNNISQDSPAMPEDTGEKVLSGLREYRWWIFYGISAAAAFLTHYYLMFSVAGQVAFILYAAFKDCGKNIAKWIKSKDMRGGIIAYIVTFVLFLPWLGTFITQLSQVQDNYWIPAMDNYSIPNTLWKMFASSNIYANNNQLIIVLIIFLAIFALALRREKNSYKHLVILSFIVPFLLAIVLSFKRSLYLDRYFVFAGIFYSLIFALFINSIERHAIRKALLIIFVISSIALFARNWQNIAPDGKPGMADASAYIFANAKPDEQVYVGSSFVFFTYKYYAYRNYFSGMEFNPSDLKLEDSINQYRIYPAYVTPLLYTPGINGVNDLPHFSGTALLTDSDLLHDFSRNVKPGDNVWILWTTGFGSSKPKDIPENWIQTDEAQFEDVLGYRGWITATKYRVQ